MTRIPYTLRFFSSALTVIVQSISPLSLYVGFGICLYLCTRVLYPVRVVLCIFISSMALCAVV